MINQFLTKVNNFHKIKINLLQKKIKIKINFNKTNYNKIFTLIKNKDLT